MSNDLFYQFLVSLFSCAVGFVAGLGVSWKTRRDGNGQPVYTPTLNTSRGMRALFVVIAILALGSVVLTAIVNDRNRHTVEQQAACNKAFISDVANNTEMVRGVALLIAQPREDRSPNAFADLLQKFLITAEENQKTRDDIDGCELNR